MKGIYVLVISLLIIFLFVQIIKLKSTNEATDKVRLIRTTLRYNIEHKIDNFTFTTIGRSAKTTSNWLKFF